MTPLRGVLASIAVLVAACVPGLPGELDPQGTGAAGASGAAGTSGAAAASGAAASKLCDPGCIPMAGCRDQAPPTSSPISTFESACTHVDQIDGRDGGWYVYAGGTSVINPSPAEPFRVACQGAAGSCFSACVGGTLSGSSWPSVIVGFVPRANALAYDMSGYSGMVFSINGHIGVESKLRFKVSLVADTMVGNGDGACTEGCYDSYRTLLSNGGGAWNWEPYHVPFALLSQEGWGKPVAWDPTTVTGVQWEIAAINESVAGDPFLLCVDQVGLVPR